jgi:hypothetical protein
MSKNGSGMSHVDDGTLNALLDGELGREETAAVEAHVAACPECAKRLAEAKRFLAEASDLLGALELPKPAATAEGPQRRVPKTAKEVALDLDGATQQSPAIRPNVAGETSRAVFARPRARRRLDFTTLAWAATVVLAIGVGFLANEVRHTRQTVAYGEGVTGRPVAMPEQARPTAVTQPVAPADQQTAAAPAASAAAGAPGARSTRPPRGARGKGTLAAGAPPATAADLARKETPALRGKQLAAADQAAAANRPEAAAKRLANMGGVGAAAQRPSGIVVTAEPAAAPARAEGNAVAAAQRGAVAAAAAPAAQPLTAFRRADLEEAVARLGGSIRLIDGMRIDHVEVGPGWRVPGAAPDLDVVRIVYADGQGRRVVLDEQRFAPSTDTSAAERERADGGMEYGDTLTTAAPNGQVRVRWVDRERFWLSLTASLPPDSARSLVGRVR